MNLTVDARDLKALRDRLAQFSDRRFQSGLAEALNKTARSVANAWASQLSADVDRPTQLTRRAARVERADLGRLQAVVRINPQGRNGDDRAAPASYLQPLEFGGDRQAKKFERALQARGAMPAGFKVVPGRYAKLDSFGNISRGQIVAVLNQLGSNLSEGYQQVISRNADKRRQSAARAGRLYLAIPRDKGRLAAGVYERSNGNLLPVFFFVARATYRRQLDLRRTGQQIAQRELGPRIRESMLARLATLQARQNRA